MQKTLRLFLFSTLFFFLGNCSKVEYGCTDKDAENYEPDAQMTCDCCVFYGRALISYSYEYHDYLKSKGVNSLQFFVNGVFNKRTKSSLFSFTRSSALTENTFSNYNGISADDENVINLSLGSAKAKTFLITVKDQNGSTLVDVNVKFKANRVIGIHL